MKFSNLFEIEYSKKFPFVKISRSNLFAIMFVALITGVGAFIMETLLDYISMGYLFDRGFLIGPFLPIYFCMVFLGLCYLKTPKISVKNFFIFFLILGGFISLTEFVVGNLWELMFNAVLWTYDGFLPFSYKYVSLTVAVLWGGLGTLYLMFIIPLFKKLADLIPSKWKKIITISFITIFTIDLILTLILIFKNGGKYRELYQFRRSVELSMFMVCIVLYIIAAIIFGRFLYKSISKFKHTFLVLYIISLIIPAFSCRDYLNRFSNSFFSFLAQLGFIIAAIYIYLILTLLVVFLIRFILKLTTKNEFIKSIKFKSICIYFSIACSIIITSIGVWSLENPVVRNMQFGSGENHLNIVAIGDVHYGSTGTDVKLEKMVDLINKENPDVVFFLGDTIDNKIDSLDIDYFYTNMANIKAKYGVYAISGNHEYEYNSFLQIKEFYDNSPIKLLLDERVVIDGVLFAGRLDAIYTDRKSLDRIIGDNKEKYPVVVLDHQPQYYDDALKANAVLELSGHTHNGQLFPGNILVQIYSKCRFGTSVIYGLYEYDDFSLYITNGYGGWGFPLKTSGRSELLKIDYCH